MTRSISESTYQKLCYAENTFLEAIDNSHHIMDQRELVSLLDSIGCLITEVKRDVVKMPVGHVRPRDDQEVIV